LYSVNDEYTDFVNVGFDRAGLEAVVDDADYNDYYVGFGSQPAVGRYTINLLAGDDGESIDIAYMAAWIRSVGAAMAPGDVEPVVSLQLTNGHGITGITLLSLIYILILFFF